MTLSEVGVVFVCHSIQEAEQAFLTKNIWYFCKSDYVHCNKIQKCLIVGCFGGVLKRSDPIEAAKKIKKERFSQAKAVFLAGSVVRDEHTAYSDLDLVVIFDHVPQAYRRSFVWKDWPIEVFVHDFSTLRYFFDLECRGGVPSLCNMVHEGICIPKESDSTQQAKRLAVQYLGRGPTPWSTQELLKQRYVITDLIDDLREPRNKAESVASAVQLYPILAGFWLRIQNKWAAQGKSIPRRLQQVDRDFAGRFERCFHLVFTQGQAENLIQLATDILQPYGGFFFDGYHSDAPKDWRKEE